MLPFSARGCAFLVCRWRKALRAYKKRVACRRQASPREGFTGTPTPRMPVKPSAYKKRVASPLGEGL
jgi:hypothetical protein